MRSYFFLSFNSYCPGSIRWDWSAKSEQNSKVTHFRRNGVTFLFLSAAGCVRGDFFEVSALGKRRGPHIGILANLKPKIPYNPQLSSRCQCQWLLTKPTILLDKEFEFSYQFSKAWKVESYVAGAKSCTFELQDRPFEKTRKTPVWNFSRRCEHLRIFEKSYFLSKTAIFKQEI